MSDKPHIILAAPPDDFSRAAAFGLPVAHMAYRIGGNGRLYRTQVPISLAGGLMVLDATETYASGDPTPLCREIVRECAARKFDGILCDFDRTPTPFLEQTAARLDALTRQHGWHLYVTEPYAAHASNSFVLIPTAISGGSLESRLKGAAEQYGGDRVTLAAGRTAKEFPLPANGSGGRILEQAELAQLVRRFSPAVYFDPNLCAHYFTYMDRGSAHFVLFDDSGSLLRKLALARQFGISRAVFAFPEVEDILTRLISE